MEQRQGTDKAKEAIGGCPYCGSEWVSREPWWKAPVIAERDAVWGTLYICRRGHPLFREDEVPTEAEILSRSGCRVYN